MSERGDNAMFGQQSPGDNSRMIDIEAARMRPLMDISDPIFYGLPFGQPATNEKTLAIPAIKDVLEYFRVLWHKLPLTA